MANVSVAKSKSGLAIIIVTNVLATEVPAVRNIYGIDKKGNTWFAPGFLPFVQWVTDDIDNLSTVCKFNKDSKYQALCTGIKKDIDALSNEDLAGFVPPVKPYAHQVLALSMAIHMPRLGLFLDPGLGKTKIGCDLIQHTYSQDTSRFWLIVALKVNQFTWAKEMSLHSKGTHSLIPITATGKARTKSILEALKNTSCRGLVVTYDTCRVAKELLYEAVPYTDVILDESHSLRSPKSGKTKAVLDLLTMKPVARRLLLSGTPSLGSPMHLWGQLKSLGEFVVPNSWHFINTYAIRSPYNKHIVTGYKRLDELNDLVTSVSLRKTAEECLDMPDRVIQIVEVPASSKTKRLYNATVRSKSIEVQGIEFTEPPNPLTVMTRLAQISMGFMYKSRKDPTICDGCLRVDSCISDSIQPYTRACIVEQVDPGRDIGLVGSTEVITAAVELVDSHVQSGKKVIVWAKHQWVLSTLITNLETLGVPLFRYDSSTKSHSYVEDSFNASASGILVAQISMGIGVTFKAPVMVYAELSWSLDHWLQSLDRNYGIRAKGLGKLLVQAVVLQNSISHSSMRLLQSKIDVSSLMSKSVECVGCTKVLECLNKGIDPFDPGCIVTPTAGKTTLSITQI
jgi:SNF2 family DNA or RNA helicase